MRVLAIVTVFLAALFQRMPSEALSPQPDGGGKSAASENVLSQPARSFSEVPGLELAGTATGSGKDPRAFITDSTSKKNIVYRLNESVRGFLISSIEEGKVTLERGGKVFTLSLIGHPAVPTAGQSDPVSVGEDGTVSIDRSGLINNDELLTCVKRISLTPHKADEGAGLKIKGVREGDIVSRAGIQEGDVIREINGQPVDSYQKALQVAGKAKNADELRIRILRAGGEKTLVIRSKR